MNKNNMTAKEYAARIEWNRKRVATAYKSAMKKHDPSKYLIVTNVDGTKSVVKLS